MSAVIYPSQNNLEQRKRKIVKNKDYNKNASENKKCLSKAKNASNQLEAPQTLRGFFFAVWFFQVLFTFQPLKTVDFLWLLKV